MSVTPLQSHNFDITENTKNKRKRYRVPTSCSLCRKRKIKCDRKRPYCSGCTTNGTSHLCKYEVQPWSKEYFEIHKGESAQQEIMDLRLQVKALQNTIQQQKLELENTPRYSLPSTNSSIEETFSDSRKYQDEGDMTILDLQEKFDCLVVKDLRLRYFGPTSSVALISNDEHASQMYSKYFKEQRRRFKEVSARHGDLKIKDEYMDAGDCSYIPSFVTDFPELPSKEDLCLLVNYFFEYCYLLFPFIDEKSFREETNAMLKPSNGPLKLTPHQESTFAVLLIMLRYAYINLPTKENLPGHLLTNALTQSSLSTVNVPSSYVEYAKNLIISPKSLGKMTLRTIQAALFLRIYKMQCPEDDDIAPDYGILLGISIQMARIHGLHRNCVKLDDELVNLQDMHLWKKIWTQLLYLDAMQSFINGSPLLISDDEFYNQLSTITFNDDLILQNEPTFITRHFTLKYLAAKLTRKISKMDRSFKRSALDELVLELNDLVYNKMRTFDQLVNSESNLIDENSYDRVQEFMLRIDLFYKLYSLYYMLFLTSDKETEKRIRKTYLILALEKGLVILRQACEFAENPSSKFGPRLENIISPYIWTPLYKIIPTLYSILIRFMQNEYSIIDFSKFFKSPDSSGLITWCKLDYDNEEVSIRNLATICELMYLKSLQLAGRFFHCYRVSFTFRIIFDYIHEIYPKSLIAPVRVDEINTNETNINKQNTAATTIGDFWSNELDPSALFDFNFFMSNLQSNLDPFFNEFNTTAT